MFFFFLIFFNDIEDVLKKLKSLAKETGLFDDFLRYFIKF